MYIYYWDRMDGEWCKKICGLFIMIFLLVIAVFLLSSFAAPYKSYAKFYKINFPDGMGMLGGALFGFFLSWVFLPPITGSISQASRREKILFGVGLGTSLMIFVIVLAVFIAAYEPKEYWSYDD